MTRNFLNAAWDRWANLHPLLRFLIASAVVLAGGFFGGKPCYRAFKAWRLERNMVAAQKAVEEVRMDDARDLSLTVLRAGDPRIEAYRILEKSTASLRDPRHGDIARALMFHPEGSPEDRFNGFRGIVSEAPLGVVGQAWGMLPADCRVEPRFVCVFADRLLSEHRYREAASILLGVPEEKRTSGVMRALVRVLIGSGKQDGYDEAQRMIAARLPGAGDEAAEWLDVLGQVPVDGLRGELVAPVRKFLDGAAGADVRRDLALARLDYAAAGEERRSALVREATGRWKDREAEALARFLLGLGLYQTLWETYPVEQVGGHTGVFPYLLQAIERGGAWERVIPLLDAHGSLIPKPEEMAHRAVAAHKTGDSPGQVRDWDSAMQEAKSSTLADVYLTLFRIAREGGLADESDAAMVEAIRLGRGPLPLYVEVKQLLGSLARQGRENTLLEVCAIYLSFEPGNPVLITQYAYLACLNNLTEPKMILKAMEALAKGFPNELPIQCVLATVYLCDGQAAKAAETLESLKMSPDKLPPSYRATYLASQVLNGRLAKDDPSVTGFPWRSLLPSERKKFTDLIQSAP